MNKPVVGIVIGSDSDLPVMQEATRTLDQLGVPYELTIASAHRTPARAEEYAASAETRGLEVIIAAAGGAAHLGGVIAAWTTLPVIGVPIKTSTLSGVDSLYSMVQMPAGVPVATVSINGAKNAAILAAQILGVKDPAIRERVRKLKQDQGQEVEAKAERLAQLGIDGYLKEMGTK
ncbi:MAG: 5-(carboxyamino)imidazole ribonucleotide mutase [Syntrophomonadaceae bacterium]|nr:5-(carboxyamino)imidazole ribonucleotide mutase [Syntrophomonadaceae bacterium]